MSQDVTTPDQGEDLKEAIGAFENAAGLSSPDYEVRDRPNGAYLVLYVGHPTDRFFVALGRAKSELSDENQFRERMTLNKRPRAPKERLSLPEARFLRTVLSESLTVDRHSFEGDFFSRYTRSVFGAEDQIVAKGNHIVFGRRGAGKSSLLAFRLHQLRAEGKPHAWVACQTYEGQGGSHVIPNVLIDILKELREFSDASGEYSAAIDLLEEISEGDGAGSGLDKLIPRVRRLLTSLASDRGPITLFLDDIHVLDLELQPRLLAKIYSLARGNQTYLKLSGIEQFTRAWSPVTREGLQYTHDVQVIRLDYNLTMPSKSKAHIESILDAHAQYCGLPSIRHLCGERVVERLVLAAAAVPRDALNLFAQAMSRSIVKEAKRVSITAVNAAVSEMAEEKLRDLQRDASSEANALKDALNSIVKFCIEDKKQNAFLVEIQNDHPSYQLLEKLIALRLLHVLHEGITPHEASRRFAALMLDFGFYVGIRAAKSVNLFQKEPAPLQAKDLRSLPKYSLPDSE